MLHSANDELIDRQTKKLQEMEKALERADNKMKLLSAGLKDVTDERNSLKAQHDKADELRKALATSEDRLRCTVEKLKRVQNTNDNLSEEIGVLKDQITIKDKKNGLLEKEIAAALAANEANIEEARKHYQEVLDEQIKLAFAAGKEEGFLDCMDTYEIVDPNETDLSDHEGQTPAVIESPKPTTPADEDQTPIATLLPGLVKPIPTASESPVIIIDDRDEATVEANPEDAETVVQDPDMMSKAAPTDPAKADQTSEADAVGSQPSEDVRQPSEPPRSTVPAIDVAPLNAAGLDGQVLLVPTLSEMMDKYCPKDK